METGKSKFKVHLQGVLQRIRVERIRSQVAQWQKLVVTASVRINNDFRNMRSGPTVSGEKKATPLSGEDGSVSYSGVADASNTPLGDPLTDDTQRHEKATDGQIERPIEIPRETSTPKDSPDSGSPPVLEVPHSDSMSTVVEKELQLPPRETKSTSPITVQQWIDSLPLQDAISRKDEDLVVIPPEADGSDSEVENLTLGAEAAVVCPTPCLPALQVSRVGGSDAGSHCSSMESLLESRRPDPEEMLLELGFGGSSPQYAPRIPSRFLRPSQMKGVNIDHFLKQQQEMADTLNSSYNGYRGLTGRIHEKPSVIVGKIMERLREAETGVRPAGGRRSTAHAIEQNSPKLATVARNLLHKLRVVRRDVSVLSADNRKWLENQGDKSPEPSSRKIIIGRQCFRFSEDGNLIPVENTEIQEETIQKPSLSVKSRSLENVSSEDLYTRPRRTSVPSSSLQDTNEDLQVEYKTISSLADQLPASQRPLDIESLEAYKGLTDEERHRIKLCLLESGLSVYEDRLSTLNLGPSLTEALMNRSNKVSSNLCNQSPLIETLALQLATLLKHQTHLLGELDHRRQEPEIRVDPA